MCAVSLREDNVIKKGSGLHLTLEIIFLKGGAGLLFEGDGKVVRLKSGDYINISSHTKHRVEWTDPDREIVWLVICYKGFN